MINKIPLVLSIQSHVAYGYAGNKAAVFPMQKLGIEVSPIYSVQLSNHTQYELFKGAFFDAEHIQEVVEGMDANNFLVKHDAIISGYIGDPKITKTIAETVTKIKQLNPNAIYCCDPVFGDIYDNYKEGRIYATPDHPSMFLKHLLPLADIITPNLFELSTLAGYKIKNHDDIKEAAKILTEKNANENQIIITTSASFDKEKTGVAAYHKGEFLYFESKKYQVQPKVHGSGDVTAAVFLSYILNGKTIDSALKDTLECLDKIFQVTHNLQTDELALIQAQEFIK